MCDATKGEIETLREPLDLLLQAVTVMHEQEKGHANVRGNRSYVSDLQCAVARPMR